jgi:hypothetical protein
MSSVNGPIGIDLLTQQLMGRFDRNKDGRLTSEEFTSVLKTLLEAQPAGSIPSSTTRAAAGARRTDHLTGFDDRKLESSQSIKYRFARAATEFGIESVTDKASAQALLESMRPAFARQGLDVLAIKGDRLQVTYEGQPLWVDVIRGSSSGSPAFQWLPDA